MSMISGQLDSRIKYQCNKDTSTVEFVLRQGSKLVGSQLNLKFASDYIKATTRDEPNFLSFYLGIPSYLSTFENTRTDKEAILGFASPANGPIITIPITAESNIFVYKDAFLCASDGVIPINSSFPLPVAINLITFTNNYVLSPSFHNSVYRVTPIQPLPPSNATQQHLLFLQAGECVTQKVLVNGESLVIQISSLIAFDSSVSVEVNQSYGVIQRHNVIMVRCKGPGRLWISTNSARNSFYTSNNDRRNMMNTSNASSPQVILSGLIGLISAVILLLFLTKSIVIDIIQDEQFGEGREEF